MWQLLCAKNRHAHAMRQCDRHGIQLGEHLLTTCRQPPCCSWWPRARCGHAGTCTFCPPQHDRWSRGVRQHFACSGAAAPHLRFWVLSAGASGSVLVHRAPSESIRPARTGPRGPPPTCTPRPQLSTCSARCESGRLFPQSSTIAMRYSPQNTFRPHAGSPHAAADARCSLQPWRHMHINAALRGHARGPASAHCIARKRKRHR